MVLHVEESARDWFVEHGYSESMGARPMGRLIQEKLKKALAEDILFGQLTDGGDVFVTANDSIEIRVEANVKGRNAPLPRRGDSFSLMGR